MNKEDLKLFSIILLFIVYIVFGVLCALATVGTTEEAGFSGFLIGGEMTILMLIPAWYIGYQIIYKKNKDFFNHFFD